MKSTYTEYHFTVSPEKPGVEILLAELAEIGFESFQEVEGGLLAYILSDEENQDLRKKVSRLHSAASNISYTRREIPQKDWNAEWESKFSPIVIDDSCQIRASFHPQKKVDYDLVINPKMAFGTGNHETTQLMIRFLLQENLKEKKILDMGCGTGVLSILAEMKGAKSIDAIDIDEWCYDNAQENAKLNDCKRITVLQGDASLLTGKKYDFILANINRNILLKDLKTYAESLVKNGVLLISGFYKKDIPLLEKEAKSYGIRSVAQQNKKKWVALKMLKS